MTRKRFKDGLSGSLFIGLLDAFETMVGGGRSWVFLGVQGGVGSSPPGAVNSRSSFLSSLTRSLCFF